MHANGEHPPTAVTAPVPPPPVKMNAVLDGEGKAAALPIKRPESTEKSFNNSKPPRHFANQDKRERQFAAQSCADCCVGISLGCFAYECAECCVDCGQGCVEGCGQGGCCY